jgi:hypothetical protein
MTEGPGVFTTPETASAPSIRTQIPRAFVLADSSHERGLVRPTAFDAIEPLTPLSRLPLPLHAHAPSCVLIRKRLLMVSEIAYGSEGEGAA